MLFKLLCTNQHYYLTHYIAKDIKGPVTAPYYTLVGKVYQQNILSLNVKINCETVSINNTTSRWLKIKVS
jgi:hypothetical protein